MTALNSALTTEGIVTRVPARMDQMYECQVKTCSLTITVEGSFSECT